MRKKGDISLTMALALLCTALILCTAGMGGASEAPPAGGPFDGCAMYRTFNDIGAAWREGLITNRDLVLAKTKAFYEERSGVDPTCSTEALEDLKQEVLEDVYRLSHELHQSDKLHLRSLSVDLAEALDRKSVSSVQAQHGTPVDHPTTFERIARALDEGRIGLKESVFLRAELLFAPRMVPPQSKFSPRPGEKVAENYWPIFNRDVHRVKDLLNQDEKALLRSLDPNLDAIVRSWEGIVGALPNYPQLTQTYTAKGTNYCQIHYTTKAGFPDAVPNVAYVALVASTLNQAIKKETQHFHAAYPEGNGLLQVYCLGSIPNPYNVAMAGEWVDVSNVPGTASAKSGYMLIDSNLDTDVLKSTIYHEYFHGVQSAYNWQSDLWFKEGSASWAEGYFGSCWENYSDIYNKADSIFKSPNSPIFDISTLWRRYSTSALVFFFSDNYGGYKFVLAYLQNSVNQNDAVANMTAALHASSFGDAFIRFLLALYNKDISSIKAYMPDVVVESQFSLYGQTQPNEVSLLGAQYYKLDPPGAPMNQAPFIAWLAPSPSCSGSPVGALAWKGSQGPANMTTAPPNPVPTSYLPNAKQEAVYIATDVTYTNSSDNEKRDYTAYIITPYVHIENVTVTPNQPIPLGTPIDINVTYDLTGTLTGQPFGVQFQIEQICNKHPFIIGGPYSVSSGEKKDFPPYPFPAGGVGTYYLTVQMRTPLDSWGIDQSISTYPQFTLVVTAP